MLLEDVLENRATMETLDLIERTAETIKLTADCAIGIESASFVLKIFRNNREDFEEHVKFHRCTMTLDQPVPCVFRCPARVDIPGYIALVNEGRYDDAVKLIRQDNPFVTACAFVCEHPCEERCRRNMLDASVNIRGIKRFAVDYAKDDYVPELAPMTGKKIAVVGGGPGGLTCAYYLRQMGHSVTVFEQRKQLGGMIRYGIPAYRFPRERLDAEIQHILNTGIEVKTEFRVGKDISFEELQKSYDAVYIAIGAHNDKKLGLEGEDAPNVMSAVDLLRRMGDNDAPDFTGKKVVVIGGGNVAMDVVRTSVRLNASKVTCAYRRRQADMTALPEEVEAAIAEGVEMQMLMAPARIETDKKGNATALWVKPQIIGKIDDGGRPSPRASQADEERIPADVIILAVGQSVDSKPFENDIPVKRGNIVADFVGGVGVGDNVFAGGDCVTGPASAIKAIAAGKVAAANIDEYLGFNHVIKSNVEVPLPAPKNQDLCGRIILKERDCTERKADFGCVELCMSEEEMHQEANRCLRCDHFGFGNFKGGRRSEW